LNLNKSFISLAIVVAKIFFFSVENLITKEEQFIIIINVLKIKI